MVSEYQQQCSLKYRKDTNDKMTESVALYDNDLKVTISSHELFWQVRNRAVNAQKETRSGPATLAQDSNCKSHLQRINMNNSCV